VAPPLVSVWFRQERQRCIQICGNCILKNCTAFRFSPAIGCTNPVSKAHQRRHFQTEETLTAPCPIFSFKFKSRFQYKIWGFATDLLQYVFAFSIQSRTLCGKAFGFFGSAPFAFRAGTLQFWQKNRKTKG